jgi:hypothetical protein
MTESLIGIVSRTDYGALINKLLSDPRPAADVLNENDAVAMVETLGNPYSIAYLTGCCGTEAGAIRVLEILAALPTADAPAPDAAVACYISAYASLALDDGVGAFCYLTAALGLDPDHIPSLWLMAALDTGIPAEVIRKLGLTMFRALAGERS